MSPPSTHAARPSLRPLLSWAVLLVLCLPLVLAACGAADAPETQEAAGGGTTASTDGAVAFAANCAVCHGPQGGGTAQGPPLVHIVYEPGHHGDDAFRRAIAQGVVPHHWDFGPMPPLPAVRADEVEAIIAHVRSLQRDAGID